MAHIIRPGVAESTLTEGTGNLTLAGREYGAVAAFFDAAIMGNDGDTCDYVIQYGDIREEGLGTRVAGPLLERTTVYWARHANGDINQTKVTLPAGVKTVFMTVASNRVARFVDAIRAQTLTQTERDQACENLGLPQSGDKAIAPQQTAWVGWTKDTNHHNKALRIVTDNNGGAFAGSVDFDTLFQRTGTDGFTVAKANLTSFNFTLTAGQWTPLVSGGTLGGSTSLGSKDGGGPGGFSLPAGATPISIGSNPNMNVPSGGSSTPIVAAIDMRVKHLNSIIVVKD